MACRHSGRHVYAALGCVFDYATIACALRWGVALIGYYHYWALLTPSWDPLSGTRSDREGGTH